MAWLAFRTLQGWIARVDAPRTWDYGPAQLAVRVSMIARGASMYRDFRTPPYLPFIHGPVVPWIGAAMVRPFPPSAMTALAAGRCLAIVSTLATAVGIFILGRRAGSKGNGAIVAALGFILLPLVQRFGFEFRVDPTALAVQIAGLIAVGEGRDAIGICAFVSAFFMKQGQLSGIAAACAWCWLRGERSRAIWLCVVCGALIAGSIAALTAFYPWYRLNSFEALRVPGFDFGAAPILMAIAIGGSAGLAILAIRSIVRGRCIDTLTVWFLGASAIAGMFSSLRWGSNAYYHLNTLAALAIVAAPEIDYLLARTTRLAPAMRIAAGLSMAGALSAGFVLAGAARALPLGSVVSLKPPPVDREIYSPESIALMRAVAGIVLTDDADLCLIDRRGNVEWIDLMMLNSMRAIGSFDDSDLLRAIAQRRYGAIALDREGLDRAYRGKQFFWPALRAVIEANYEPAGDGPPFLMLPRRPPG